MIGAKEAMQMSGYEYLKAMGEGKIPFSLFIEAPLMFADCKDFVRKDQEPSPSGVSGGKLAGNRRAGSGLSSPP